MAGETESEAAMDGGRRRGEEKLQGEPRADASFKSQPNSLQRSNNNRDNDNDAALVARKRIVWNFLARGVFFFFFFSLSWILPSQAPLAGRLPRFGDAKWASLLGMTNNTSSAHYFSTLFLPG